MPARFGLVPGSPDQQPRSFPHPGRQVRSPDGELCVVHGHQHDRDVLDDAVENSAFRRRVRLSGAFVSRHNATPCALMSCSLGGPIPAMRVTSSAEQKGEGR